MNRHVIVSIGICVAAVLTLTCSANAAEFIQRDTLPSRTHSTWEGPFTFSEDEVVRIKGLPDLHVLIYRDAARESMLIEITVVESADRLLVLLEAETDPPGVTPALEGIDALPGDNEAQVVVRWRHPGQGGERTVKTYRYTIGSLELVDHSDLLFDGISLKWVPGGPGPSIPATPAEPE